MVMPFLSIASMSFSRVQASCTPKCGILRWSSQSDQPSDRRADRSDDAYRSSFSRARPAPASCAPGSTAAAPNAAAPARNCRREALGPDEWQPQPNDHLPDLRLVSWLRLRGRVGAVARSYVSSRRSIFGDYRTSRWRCKAPSRGAPQRSNWNATSEPEHEGAAEPLDRRHHVAEDERAENRRRQRLEIENQRRAERADAHRRDEDQTGCPTSSPDS